MKKTGRTLVRANIFSLFFILFFQSLSFYSPVCAYSAYPNDSHVLLAGFNPFHKIKKHVHKKISKLIGHIASGFFDQIFENADLLGGGSDLLLAAVKTSAKYGPAARDAYALTLIKTIENQQIPFPSGSPIVTEISKCDLMHDNNFENASSVVKINSSPIEISGGYSIQNILLANCGNAIFIKMQMNEAVKLRDEKGIYLGYGIVIAGNMADNKSPSSGGDPTSRDISNANSGVTYSAFLYCPECSDISGYLDYSKVIYFTGRTLNSDLFSVHDNDVSITFIIPISFIHIYGDNVITVYAGAQTFNEKTGGGLEPVPLKIAVVNRIIFNRETVKGEDYSK